MKKCGECGERSIVRTGFCVVCGSKLEFAANSRRARRLFFLTPFFIVAFFAFLLLELSDSIGFNLGIIIGGNFAVLYLLAGTIFWLVAKIAKISVSSDSKWRVGLFTVSQLILTGLMAILLEDKVLQSSNHSFSISEYASLKWQIILMAYLPALFTAYFTLFARKTRFRLETNLPGSRFYKMSRFLIFNSLLLMTLASFLLSSMIFLFSSPQRRALLKARVLSDIGANKDAEKAIDTAFSLGEPDPDLLFFKSGLELAKIAENKSSVELALKFLNQALAKEPENTLFLLRLSTAYELSGDIEKAVEVASNAAFIGKTDYILWQNLGDLQLKDQDLDGAVLSYKMALKNFPDNPSLLNNLAYTLLEQGKELPLALELARKSVEIRPGAVYNLDTLAWALYKNGRLNESLEILSKIFQGRTEVSPEVDFHYAAVLYDLKMLKEPLATFKKMLSKPEVINDYTLFKQIDLKLKEVESDMQQKTDGKEKGEGKK